VSSVFLSYRHENDAHRVRVRELAERLHTAGINVVLDQFFLDAHPGGPDEGWAGWTYRQAANADKILIVASPSWFRSYAGIEAPVAGLGAAWEARLIQQRLYESAGSNPHIRMVAFDPNDADSMPLELRSYHIFNAERDLARLVTWLGGTSSETVMPSSARASWLADAPTLEWQLADRDDVRSAFSEMLTASARYRILLLRGPGGIGKTTLVRYFTETASHHHWLSVGALDCKGGVGLEVEFTRFVTQLGINSVLHHNARKPMEAQFDALLTTLRERNQPTLMSFDTFEQGGELASVVEEHLLREVPRASWLRVVIAGQFVPETRPPWADFAQVITLGTLPWEAWYDFGKRHRADLTPEFARQIHTLAQGHPGLLGALLKPAEDR
jgi:hypothetical protein